MGVGGTHATCSSGMTNNNPACGGYGSESAWSGSGGGASAHYAKPTFQTGCSVPADGKRDVPDVALEADTSPGNYIAEAGGWYIVGGTSDAAPSWAGYFAELNQKKGGSGLGLPGARLYALCGGNSFHDITSGNNGAFSAGAGYDKVTGIGTINAANLLANY
jgi:kumamolisin